MPIADGSPLHVAFHAPIKPPDHPIASGDREIARLIVKALERPGCAVEIASRFIAYQKRPSHERFKTIRTEGRQEAERLIAEMKARPVGERPDIWLTYHPYCKAPDWLGPAVTKALGIPYATVEAARTRQNKDCDWQGGREAVRAAICHASANFCLKPSDNDYLREVLMDDASIVPLAPFIDIEAVTAETTTPPGFSFGNDDPVLLVVGMMRPNKKAESYAFLAEALMETENRNWNLVLIGDGPERETVERAFSFVAPERLRFTGAVEQNEVLAAMRASDVFAWPGIGEAIGMVFLEAEANGLPVVALRSLGVPRVVEDGETGLLADEGDVAGYRALLERLIGDPVLRKQLGGNGRERIRARHGLDAACETFRDTFSRLTEAS